MPKATIETTGACIIKHYRIVIYTEWTDYVASLSFVVIVSHFNSRLPRSPYITNM